MVSLYRREVPILMTKRGLTDFPVVSVSRPELVAMLLEAGLELWQSPEGFWAVRLKPITAPQPVVRPATRRRQPGRLR